MNSALRPCHPELVEGLSLSLFEAGILFVDNIKLALTTHNLAVGTSFFDGCSNFHIVNC